MSYKPDEKDWMAYLYGELEGAAKEKFDRYLTSDPDGAMELEKYQNIRKLLSEVDDKEIIAPPLVITDEMPVNSGRQYFWNTPHLRTIATVAASLLLVILAGKLTGTRISVSDHEFSMSFGEVPVKEVAPVTGMTPDQVQQMINASLSENNDMITTSLEETRAKLESSVRNNLALSSGRLNDIVKEASTASQQQIRQYVDGIRTENMQQVKEYFQLTSTEQKQYIENLLVDFSKYLQQQRNDDLQLVQMRMNNLEQHTDMFRQETEQILSSILTTVNNPATGEIKN